MAKGNVDSKKTTKKEGPLQVFAGPYAGAEKDGRANRAKGSILRSL